MAMPRTMPVNNEENTTGTMATAIFGRKVKSGCSIGRVNILLYVKNGGDHRSIDRWHVRFAHPAVFEHLKNARIFDDHQKSRISEMLRNITPSSFR